MNKAYNEAAEYLMKKIPKFKVLMHSIDKENPNLVHDIQWFADKEAFNAQFDMSDPETKDRLMKWLSFYDLPDNPFTGVVFGGWD